MWILVLLIAWIGFYVVEGKIEDLQDRVDELESDKLDLSNSYSSFKEEND